MLANISTNNFSNVMLQTKMRKRSYNERVLQVDPSKFTPLVFSIYRSMGRVCHKFYSCLSDLLSEKHNVPKSKV